ncbi:MAG: Arginine-tRNA ligase [Berkelbacteria bacterium GW2011_GWA2_46_7]|uniref:Arginine--tRNA ligase n=1 Tax=Berkelbacteria bacterium GW2011_GWA2_46_7 TaxID=1618335 RepID=A0A0G1QI93_9BACT|nr:MAG: Arginine-tRNA ligase [Berkelbacteria bacterium GW2011_GWA2_46_7]
MRTAYRKVYQTDPPRFGVEPALHKMFGDFSTNIALVTAADNNTSPMMLAQKLVPELEASHVFRSVSVTTPGFINFTITDEHLLSTVKEIIKSPDAVGRSDLGKESRVLVEYISANPTGPLTLGNARGAFVGETISRILELYGCTVMREYYVNDRGGQIEILGHSVLKDDKAEYRGEYIDALAKRIKEKDPVAVGEKASAIVMEEMIKPMLKKVGIDFHQFFSESSLYQTGVYKKTLELLKAKGYVYEADGATWLATSRFGDEKDRVLIRSTGEETYFMSDIAYHSFKIGRGYHRLINIVGADHYTYSTQLTKVIEGILRHHYMWGGTLNWVITQIVRLVKDGQEIKMSKRAGTYVALDDVLEEIGPDVARFFFINKSTDTHLDFDLNLAKASSNQNPVFYIQYAYARISSIFRQFSKEEDFVIPERIIITHPIERQLLLRIIQFPDLVEEIAGNLEVHRLTHYATALATDLHTFYETVRVVGEAPEIANSRLAILKATSLTIKKTLDLIGISAPSRMVDKES